MLGENTNEPSRAGQAIQRARRVAEVKARPGIDVRAWSIALLLLIALLAIARPAPALAATADAGSDETTAIGRPVALDGSGSTAEPSATYTWDFGDGSPTESTISPSHNYRFAGSYTATLTVTDSGGSSTDTATVSIEMSATNIDYSKFPADRADYLIETTSTRYVALDGNDVNDGSKASPFATIQNAIADATTGTVILVRGGHYFTGDIVIDKSDLVLAAYPGEKVVLESDAYDQWEHSNGIMLSGPISNVVVDGLELRRYANSGLQFGDENTQRNIIVKNLVIDGALEAMVTAYSSGGDPTAPFIDGMLVKNVTLQRVGMIGFNAGQYADIPVYRNVKLENVYALLNGMGDDTAADAIAFENGENVLAENCVVQNASGDGFDFKANNAAVVNSIARHIARNGVKLWSNGQIVNSLTYDTGADAGVVLESGSYRIVNSVLAQHLVGQQGGAYSMTAGYDNTGFAGAEVFRSIFYEECDRFYVNNTGPGSLSLKENIFWNFELNRILQYGDVDYETPSAINAQPWGGGNEERDPGFADPDNDDWHIASGSNGFVYPELNPPPVVTVTTPAYPKPVGLAGSIRWRSDQAGSYRLEATSNAVGGSGSLLATGTVQKGASTTTTFAPSLVPADTTRLYLFVTNSADATGWEDVKADMYQPRTSAPYASRIYRYRYARLYYRVTDPFSARAYVWITIANRRGRWVRTLRPGWVGTGPLRYYRWRATLPRGWYRFNVQALDVAGNRHYNIARNWLVIR